MVREYLARVKFKGSTSIQFGLSPSLADVILGAVHDEQRCTASVRTEPASKLKYALNES